MSFRHLKTAMIILLCAVNLVLGISLGSLYRAEFYYDEEVIARTAAILREGGIEISDGEIDPRRREYPILIGETVSAEQLRMTFAMRLSGDGVTENFAQHMITNGIRIIHAPGGDQLDFYSDSAQSPSASYSPEFVYRRGGESGITSSEASQLEANGIEPDSTAVKNALSAIRTQLFTALPTEPLSEADGTASAEYGLRVLSASSSADGSVYALRAAQTVEGLDIGDAQLLCIVSAQDNTLLYAEGSLLLSPIVRSHPGELTDEVAALLSELRRVPDGSFGPEGSFGAAIESCELIYYAKLSGSLAGEGSPSADDAAAADSSDGETDPAAADRDDTASDGRASVSGVSSRLSFVLIPSWEVRYSGQNARIIGDQSRVLYRE